MTVNQPDFLRALLACILFECAGRRRDDNSNYLIKDLAIAFAHARVMFSTNPKLKASGRAAIDLHSVHTSSGLRQYLASIPQGIVAPFPYETPVIHQASLSYLYSEDYVHLPACSSRQVNDFFQSYAEIVDSIYHDDIAAVIQYLRVNCWTNKRGSGGPSIVLMNGLTVVEKYSRAANIEKRKRFEQIKAMSKQTKTLDLGSLRLALEEDLSTNTTEARYNAITAYLNELRRQSASAETRRKVETIRKTLENSIRAHGRSPNAEVRLFGSFESGLCTNASDADFTVYNLIGTGDRIIYVLARILREAGYGPITTIGDARVPIVSFTEQGIHCDMNVNQPMGIINSQLINAYQKIDTRFLGLWFGIRQLANKYGILGASTGYLSSYALTMMLIVFLQDVTSPPILPKLQQQSAVTMSSYVADGVLCTYDRQPRNYTALAAKNTQSEGQLLVEFCKYYGYTFKYATQEVNPCVGVIRARTVPTPQRSKTDFRLKDWAICVLDPFLTTRNVAGNCRNANAARIRLSFQSMYNSLREGDLDRAFMK
ncbi:hypothetical protein FBU30_007761 [Linnemannia zychae]|nr:hypothetical protein FBU30_007761 [Linnemannia zychae]